MLFWVVRSREIWRGGRSRWRLAFKCRKQRSRGREGDGLRGGRTGQVVYLTTGFELQADYAIDTAITKRNKRIREHARLRVQLRVNQARHEVISSGVPEVGEGSGGRGDGGCSVIGGTSSVGGDGSWSQCTAWRCEKRKMSAARPWYRERNASSEGGTCHNHLLAAEWPRS